MSTATKSVTIRHAVFRWKTADDPPKTELAVRGQTVVVPVSEVERALAQSPVNDPPFVPENVQLAQAGEMVPITADSSPEEFYSWVGSATGAEIAQLLVDQPSTETKIGDALSYLVRTRTPSVVAPVIPGLTVNQPYPGGQHPVEAAHAAAAAGQTLRPGEFGYGADSPDWNPLDGTPPRPSTGLFTGTRLPSQSPEELFGQPSETPPTPGSAPDVQAHAGDALTPPGEPAVDLDPSTAAEAVEGSVAQVSAYLAENPDQAQAVLEAETARADAARAAGDERNANVRKGVEEAARAAAGHTPA